MDIRKFMTSKNASKGSESNSTRNPKDAPSQRPAGRRSRVARTVIIDDDDEDGDDVMDVDRRSGPGTSQRALRSKTVDEDSIFVVDDDDDDEDEDDDIMRPGSIRRDAITSGKNKKRTRAGASDSPMTANTGAGFGGVEDEVVAGEPDPKKTKRAAQMAAFNKFKNRGGPPNAGKKPLPVGAKNCLNGKVFVITGVLDSLEREECTELIKEYGGRVVSGVSKKVTHGIVGLEPGDSKMKKLNNLKTTLINEDDLFSLISKTRQAGSDVPKRQTAQKAKKEADPGLVTSRVRDDVTGQPRFQVKPRSDRVQGGKSSPGRVLPSLWVDKYRPVNVDELVANPGIYKQIASWLNAWKSRHLREEKGTKKKSSRVAKDEDAPALLLAGPPGIGKTTAAHAICRSNGFEPLEFNASDVRNKAGVQDLASSIMLGASMTQFLGPSVSTLARSPFLAGTKKQRAGSSGDASPEYVNGPVLIMDEVDGMSGGDRGGSQELIKMFKLTKVPIICICNDDGSQKMRTLAGHCLKLKFRRPMATQVRDRLLFIAQREGYRTIDSQTAERLANGCHGDIRQMINMLQSWRLSSSSLSYQDVRQRLDSEGKTFETLSTFDLALSFFAQVSPSNSVLDRMDNFFLDSDMVPLFVEENYLSTAAARSSLAGVADAAESISDGDLCNAQVRFGQRWDLMPALSVLSSVLPGALLSGGLAGQRLAFPSALGHMSKTNKFKRMTRELEMRVKAAGTSSGSTRSFRLDYLPTMTMTMATPLIKAGAAAIPDVIERLDAYYLQKEDWSGIMELGVFKEKRGPLDAIPGQVKAALTREYNKMDHVASTVTEARIGSKGAQGGDAITKRKMAAAASDVAVVDEEPVSEDDVDAYDSDVELDQFKVKRQGKKGSGGTKASRGRGGRGRGARGGRASRGRGGRK